MPRVYRLALFLLLPKFGKRRRFVRQSEHTGEVRAYLLNILSEKL